MQKILSIIVPTYNMEQLLRDDLQSLVVEPGLMSKLELIVVNDGSTDRSSEIAHEFERSYPGIFIVIDKKNGNYGSCINVGLAKATGKYVRILDADDKFDTVIFENFLKELENVDADIVFNDYAKTYTSGLIKPYIFDLPPHKKLPLDEVIDNKAIKETQLPSITYRRSIFDGLNYHQTEGVSYTDTEWCFSPIVNASSIYYIPGCLYLYFMGREGQTMAPEVFKRSLAQRMLVLDKLIVTEARLNIKGLAKYYLNQQLLRHLEPTYRYFLIDNPDIDRSSLEKMDKMLERLNPEVFEKSGLFEYRKKIRYKYVSKWRCSKYKKVPLKIRLYEKVLDFIGYYHALFLKIKKNR